MEINIGHIHNGNQKIETLFEHLEKTSILAGKYCEKIDIGALGEFTGFIHDIGKADLGFTAYILQENGILPEELYQYRFQNRNDHSTMSGQFINQIDIPMSLKKILAEVCMSHHTGLINYIHDDGSITSDYEKRIKKDISYEKVLDSLGNDIYEKIDELIKSSALNDEFKSVYDGIQSNIVSDKDNRGRQFMLALLTKFIFSCLCDADRNATAAFMNEEPFENHLPRKMDWSHLNIIFENFIAEFKNDTPINKIRSEISRECFEAADADKGEILVLNVPTGGGKTLSTLRFALNHVLRNDMDRIIYVLPYTSIIEQNAAVVRDILDKDNEGDIVLECHSNLSTDEETEITRLLAQNWNAPIVFTTMVQFLESIFSGNIRSNRRMHNLANSVIIFDEVQCVPGKCIYMFNEFIRFITKIGKSTAVLCTATQPLLNDVPADRDGINRSLEIAEQNNIIPARSKLSERLKRVEIIDERKLGKWSDEEIIELALHENVQSVLIIVNTKSCANALYELIKGNDECESVYLSTNMYPEHRKKVIGNLKEKLGENTKKIICISTQLIEAGVDIDFDCVIRSLAGMDSIAQAAGRCNRNGLINGFGRVHIVNSKSENLSRLQDIKRGQQSTIRILDMYKTSPEKLDNNLLGHKAISKYFEFLYCDLHGANTKHFEYLSDKSDSTLFELLSINKKNVKQYIRENGKTFNPRMVQSFMTAGRLFNVIDSTARGVIVQHGEGKSLINELVSEENPKEISALLRRAQSHSINVFPYKFDSLLNNGIYKINENLDAYYLCESLYDETIGLCSGNNNFLSID